MGNITAKILANLKRRYRIMILRDDTFAEKGSFGASLWVLALGVFCFFLLFFLFYSALHRLINGEDNTYNRSDLLKAYAQIDSLEHVAKANEAYLVNLRNVMNGTAGETMMEAEKRDKESVDTLVKEPETINLSDDEKVLRDLLTSGSSFAATKDKGEERRRGIASYAFYRPVNGIVSGSFDEKIKHYATDIATKVNEPIKSTLDGHVIFASFTPSTGYVIIVQHANNLLSVYKHCAAILKKEGSFVRGGEVIALAGNTGELTTGPHLHFELWYNGNAINAENYINF